MKFHRQVTSLVPHKLLFFLVLIAYACLSSCGKATLGSLDQLALGKTDKASSHHGYTEIYEHFFRPLRNKHINLCEIGIAAGGSLKLWEQYFTHASIYGIDVNDCSKLNSKRIQTFITDQGRRDELEKFIQQVNTSFDIIIDDGGHRMKQQQLSMGVLFKTLRPGGIYIIEDIHTSLPLFYPRFDVDPDENNSTLQMVFHFLKSGLIKSSYMYREEELELTYSIAKCHLFFNNEDRHSIAAIFEKR